MNGLNANERENQSITRAPTETKMDVLTYAKAKMLLTSRHYLKVAQMETESNSKPHQQTDHLSVAQTTR